MCFNCLMCRTLLHVVMSGVLQCQDGHNFMLSLACRSVYKGLAYFSRRYLNRSYSLWLPLTVQVTVRISYRENYSPYHVICLPAWVTGEFFYFPKFGMQMYYKETGSLYHVRVRSPSILNAPYYIIRDFSVKTSTIIQVL